MIAESLKTPRWQCEAEVLMAGLRLIDLIDIGFKGGKTSRRKQETLDHWCPRPKMDWPPHTRGLITVLLSA